MKQRKGSFDGAAAAEKADRPGKNGAKAGSARVKFINPKTDLEAAVQRFVELYDFAPIAYVSFDRVGRIDEVNFAAAKLLGKARNTLLGQPFALCVYKPDAQEFLRHLLFCRTQRKRVETDLNLRGRANEIIPVTLSSTPTGSFAHNGALLYQTVIVDLRERKKAEAELRAKEERYRTLFDLVSVAVYTCNANGFIQEFNQRAVELWGREPARDGAKEKYCGSFKIFYPDGRPMPHEKCPMARALRGEELKQSDLEILVEQPNGARRNVIVHPKILKNERGKIVGAINCLYDITDRKKAEAALRQSEEQFRRAIEDAPIPVIMHAEDGQVLQFSKTWTELTGYTTKDIPTFDAWLNRAYGFGAEEVRGRVRRLFRGDPRLTEAEFEIITRSGERRNWAFSASSPGTLHDGRRFVVGMALDITARKRAEAELRESEEQLRAVLDQTTAAMGRTDLSGKLIFVNDKFCQLLGYTRNELLGKTLQERTHPDDLKENMRLFRRMVTKGIPYEMEKRFICKDGSSIWANVSASPIRDAAGKFQSAVAVVLDISDRKKAERALREAKLLLETRVRERTAALLATNQELQNEIAERKRLEGEILEISDREQRRLGQDLHDSLCQHLTATAFLARAVALRLKKHRVIEVEDINKIADFINEGVTEARTVARGLHPVQMDAVGLVTALRTMANKERGQTQCTVEADDNIEISDPTVALHLFRIAREAVNNAYKHARAREIFVRMRASRESVELSVSDDGIGLPPNFREGAGMGFHIMNYRARSIAAQLDIKSAKPRGTSVICRLPRK
jgi:PAS domain S-box-containing protein